jgi:hypothetical protein
MVPMMRIAPVCTCPSAWFTEKKLAVIRPEAISFHFWFTEVR